MTVVDRFRSQGAEAVAGEAPSPPWFVALLSFYLERRKTGARTAEDGGARPAGARADEATRRARARSALAGATAGLVSTGAAALTAETKGLGGIVALPVAALAIGAEMALRTLIHVDLICTMADIFGVPIDPDDPDELWPLCALLFGSAKHLDDARDLGKLRVHALAHLDVGTLGAEIGERALGESVVQDLLPVLGVGIAAAVNWRRTQRVGDTARRYMRFSRALADAFHRVSGECSEHLELLVEGVWFVFVADGRLGHEESAALAKLVKKLPHHAEERVLARFVEDEGGWLERVAAEVKGAARAPFLHALEVAAAVDKVVGLPERRLLRSAARRLDLPYDPKRVEAMVEEIESTGMLAAS